jgi:hypothetical protein
MPPLDSRAAFPSDGRIRDRRRISIGEMTALALLFWAFVVFVAPETVLIAARPFVPSDHRVLDVSWDVSRSPNLMHPAALARCSAQRCD